MLASGESVALAPMEKIIMSSSLVGGTLIVRRGGNLAVVLLEPRPGVDVSDLVKFRNKIWLIIEEANETLPAFSWISKEMILITKREKPMFRTQKGTHAKYI